MFRLAIEKTLNHMINVNDIGIERIDNKIISLKVEEMDLSLFFLSVNSRVFVLDKLQNKKFDVSIILNKASFLSLLKGSTIEELIEREEVEINGNIKTAQQLADLLVSSSIDIEELISEYTGDIVSHQLGHALRQFKKVSLKNDGSIINNLKDGITTALIAPGRSKLFKRRMTK